MFAGDGVVVDNQDAHILRAEFFGSALYPVGSPQRDGDGERRTDALFAVHRDVAVHHLHDVLRDGHAQPGTAVFIGLVLVLLGEGVKDFRKVGFVHADTRIFYDKAHGGVPLETGLRLHEERHGPAGGRELDGVAQDVDKNLFELHVVADVVVVHMAGNLAVIAQSLALALSVNHGVNLFQHFPERKLLVFQGHAPAFNAAHVQDVVNQPQQVLRAPADFLQMLPGALREAGVFQRDTVQADDGVHGRPDFVAHGGQEGRFRGVGLFRLLQRVFQRLPLFGETAFHVLLLRDVHKDSNVGNRASVGAARELSHRVEPAPAPVLGQ